MTLHETYVEIKQPQKLVIKINLTYLMYRAHICSLVLFAFAKNLKLSVFSSEKRNGEIVILHINWPHITSIKIVFFLAVFRIK